MFPMPAGYELLPAGALPQARAKFTSVPNSKASQVSPPPDMSRVRFVSNERITSVGWFQDVRHIEFEMIDTFSYVMIST
jgi:hypothetical protein